MRDCEMETRTSKSFVNEWVELLAMEEIVLCCHTAAEWRCRKNLRWASEISGQSSK